MPKYTLNTVIQKAIYPAVCDREAMLDADRGRRTETQAEMDALEALRGTSFDRMTDAQKDMARMALTWAAQWEYSVADSQGKNTRYGREAFRRAQLCDEHRHQQFGKNALEAMFDVSTLYTLRSDGQWRDKAGNAMPFRTLK